MMRFRLVLAIALLAGFSDGGLAQQLSAPSSVETVTVTANSTAPAIWHAVKGGADVAILGIVQPLPDNFIWNTKPLEKILDTARLVLLPPRVEMGIFSGAWFYLTERDLLQPPEGKTLWDVLDPQVAARLAAACDLLHEPRDRYGDSAPIVAAMHLGSDFRHVFYLTTHEPEDAIQALARAQRIEVRRIATYDLVPSGRELLNLPPALTGRCIDAVVSDIDFQSRHVQAAAEAWAIGDIAGMKANWSQSKLYDCLIALSSRATALDTRAIDDTVNAIADAIDGGGRSVAVVDVGNLLRRYGVLDRLKAQGVGVAGPGAETEQSEFTRPNKPS
jgi:hypothetical protein